MALDKVVKLKALMDNYKLAGRVLGLREKLKQT